MLGLHSDGAGNWEYTDGSLADMDFLRAHSNDQLEGVAENQMVFHPGSGLNDCCGSWQIHGFVCEHYAAPDTFAIGLNRGYSDAEAFCQSQYNGHLASIHTQHDYDKIMTMATGYTLPVLIGGKLDNGEWSWEDGSYFDLDFVTSHSWDQLGSGAPGSRAQEDQMVSTSLYLSISLSLRWWSLYLSGGLPADLRRGMEWWRGCARLQHTRGSG